jgi:hypothetical protein
MALTARERLAIVISSGRGCSGADCEFCLVKADAMLEVVIDIVEELPYYGSDIHGKGPTSAAGFRRLVLAALQEEPKASSEHG